MKKPVVLKTLNYQKLPLYKLLLPYYGIITVILVFGFLTNFRSISVKNLSLVLDQSYVMLISATGIFFIMTMGSIDFSPGSVIGVSSIVVAYLSAKTNLGVAMVGGMAVGALIGALNGVLHVKFRISSFIVTICTMFIFRGVCAFLTTSKPMSAPMYLYEFNGPYFLIPITAFVIVLGSLFFRKTLFGRYLKAIGAGEVAAKFSGVRVDAVKFAVFTLSGLLTGLAGTLNTIRVGSITATSGSLLETNIMIALVLGGMPVSGGAKNRFSSVLIGVILLGLLNNGLVMLQMDPNIQQLIKGFIFLVIVSINVDRDAVLTIK